jgi:hypothetical protein
MTPASPEQREGCSQRTDLFTSQHACKLSTLGGRDDHGVLSTGATHARLNFFIKEARAAESLSM